MYDLTKKFANDTRGITAILFGLMVPAVCLCAGAAIDFGRLAHARNITANALDSAVLAGASTLWRGGTDEQALAAAQKHYEINVVNRFAVVNDTIAFNIADDGTAITGSGNAELPTTLLQIAGFDAMPLIDDPGASFPKAKITGGGSSIEVSLMLDVTGSMCADGTDPCTSGAKIDGMKDAAKDLINFVVRDEQTPYTSRVALVPFAKRIRVAPDGAGAGIMKAMTNLDATWSGWYNVCDNWVESGGGGGGEMASNWTCESYTSTQVSNWKIRPCVTSRFFKTLNEIDYTDELSGLNQWLNGNGGERYPLSEDSTETPPTIDTGLTESEPAYHDNYSSSGSCSVHEDNQIVPLSADRDVLKNKIDGFEGDSKTAGALGTAFSWYMLSPKWSSIWPAESAPGPYSDLTTIQSNGHPKLRKIAVIMSDGVYNALRATTSFSQQEVSDFAVQLCTNMKAEGIEIYTVGFELDSLPAAERAIAETALKACGTDLEHFYNAYDPGELKQSFRDIATKLGSVSLVR